jgi:LPXTG-motif cell wall-anchored protein
MTVTGTPDHGDNRVFVFNTRTRALIGQFDATSSFGNTANGLLSVSPDSSQVVVVNYGETSSLRFVSTVSLTTVQELALEIYDMAGLGLLEAVFTPDGTSVVFPSQLVAGIFIVDVDPPLAVSDQALPDTGADFGSLGLFGVAVALLGVALLAYKRRVR